MADKDVKAKTEEDEPEAKSKVKFTTVRSSIPAKPDSGNPVALYERNAAHPGGEAFVAGDKPVKVAVTAEVSRLIRDGILVEV